MLEQLKLQVYEANLALVEMGLVLFTWGNASAISHDRQHIVIKPSGVSYQSMQPDDMVVVRMDGSVVEGTYKPSSDTPTHLVLYQQFEPISAIVHTHAKWATIWAQALRPIPFLGTTHADNFYGDIPVTRKLTAQEIQSAYEVETGNVIVETFTSQRINPVNIPGVLVANHGPFTWGQTTQKAVENAAALEYVAEMAYYTLDINPQAAMDQSLLDKHFLRKHGKDAYYGQV